MKLLILLFITTAFTLSLKDAVEEIDVLNDSIVYVINDLNPIDSAFPGDQQKLTDLMNLRLELKKAIMQAENVVRYDFSGMEMTVAEAKDYKRVIDYKKVYRDKLEDVLETLDFIQDIIDEQNAQIHFVNSVVDSVLSVMQDSIQVEY